MKNPVNDDTWQEAVEKEGDYGHEDEKWRHRTIRGMNIQGWVTWNNKDGDTTLQHSFDTRFLPTAFFYTRIWTAVDYGEGYEGLFQYSEITGFRVVRSKS
tara:strand:+ start:975 stop:1274 length:300 start_codon:yes stop_codon:yes gene_type:complete